MGVNDGDDDDDDDPVRMMRHRHPVSLEWRGLSAWARPKGGGPEVHYGLPSLVYTLRQDFDCLLTDLVSISAHLVVFGAEINTKYIKKQTKSCRKVYTWLSNP